MPELPEVETVVRGLRASLPGRTFLEVRLGKTDFIDDPQSLGQHVPGTRVAAISRLGKFICIQLASESRVEPSVERVHLVIHLGMTGKLTIAPAGDPVAPHTHCFFVLDDSQELRYTDIRRFGRILLVPESLMSEFRGNLGSEPLDISVEEFCRAVGLRGARIKAVLLNQSILCGIGNIYADESLFRARLHPMRIARQLTRTQLIALHRAIREVLAEAIRFRGSSISDYVDTEGKRGEFQLRHRVYRREGKPCVRCRTKILRVIVAGRSSHFCPKCQPIPRARKKIGQNYKKN